MDTTARTVVIVGLAAFVGFGIVSNMNSDDEPTVPTRPPAAVVQSDSDSLIVDAAWSTLSPTDKAQTCAMFWSTDDDDVITILTTGADAVSQHQAEMAVEHFYDVC